MSTCNEIVCNRSRWFHKTNLYDEVNQIPVLQYTLELKSEGFPIMDPGEM
jgi:hypothetical protein